MPDIQEIVRLWLEANGYGGLAGYECGCELANLFPCGQYGGDCEAGYKVACTPECHHDCGPCDWHIQTKKPEAPDAR